MTHRYPESEGLPEFREAVADWYSRRFGVELEPETEALSLIGAKEGIGHLPTGHPRPWRHRAGAGPGVSRLLGGDAFRGGGELHAAPD